MTTLVLNIDRDNDFGDKAGIVGPLVGYTECYNAAMKLVSIDPEDSDSNALFGAAKHYEDLIKRGEDVELALVTGDQNVGEKSDEIIGKQLDEVLSMGKYDNLILVTDGAEDDFVIPLITSRIKIRYVKHIIVRHNQDIESLYYYIVRALNDKKVVNKIIIPFGLVFLTYGIVSLVLLIYSTLITKATYIAPSAGAVTFVTIVLGSYFVEKGFSLGKVFLNTLREIRKYAEDTRISFVSYVISTSLIFAGFASSYVATYKGYSHSILDAALVFISFYIWWLYGAIASRETGKAVEAYMNNRKYNPAKIIYSLLFFLSLGFVIYGMINYIRYVLGFITFRYIVFNVILIVLGIVIAVLSFAIHRTYAAEPEASGASPIEQSIFEGKQ